MKYVLVVLTMLASCSSQMMPVSSPPGVVTKYIHDTTVIKLHDTTTIRDTSVVYDYEVVEVPAQISHSVYELPIPSGGDDQATLQKNIDTAIALGYRVIHFPTDGYQISQGLVLRNPNGSFLLGVKIYADGGDFGLPTLTVTRPDGFGLDIIGGKGCIVQGIIINGMNTGLLNYTAGQILSGDTSSFLTNGVSADPVAPHAGFVIDGYGYPATKGLARIGSTDIQFIDCRAQYLTVGFCLQPGGVVSNGEIIKIENCWGDYCRSAVSVGEAQERTVLIDNFHCWGGTKTVFDMRNFGTLGSANGCPPEVYGLNVAGSVRYLCEQTANFSKGLIVDGGHLEAIWSLGGCPIGPFNRLTLRGCWVSFATWGNSIPSSIYQGAGLICDHTFLFEFDTDAGSKKALHYNSAYAYFDDTAFDSIPISVQPGCKTSFKNCAWMSNVFDSASNPKQTIVN